MNAYPHRIGRPRTRVSLGTDLGRIGLGQGATVLLHSSLRALGWVCGGPVAVVQALLDVLGPEGTLVVPTHTADNSDPAGWTRPPVPETWWAEIRRHTPAYDPQISPARGMGVIAETVRTWPGSRRSGHPQSSFAALGPQAEKLLAVHDLDCRLGGRSPLGALEQLDALVLLLGVGYGSCTAFHLAEYRVPDPRRATEWSAVTVPDGRQWVSYDDVDLDSSDFPALGQSFESALPVASGPVGDATARLFPLRSAVSYATAWLPEHRLG